MGTLKSLSYKLIFWFIVLFSLIVLLIPIYYMISSSFKSQAQMMDIRQLFIFKPRLNNYINIFQKHNILNPLTNSLIISVSATGLACLMGLPAAYAIARHSMYKLAAVILVVRIVPAVTFLVPWYIILSKLGLQGTRIALIMANLLVLIPLLIWIVSPYFASISKELEEAAFIDGCSEAGSFVRIMIPLSIPGIVTATILGFIQAWNNYMFAYVLGGSAARTLPVTLKMFIGYQSVDYATLMSAAVVVAMPVVLISIVLQKYVISGLTAGAVKG